MSPQQLANVLIKVMGLSMVLSGIPAVLINTMMVFRISGQPGRVGGLWVQPLIALLVPLIGAILMAKSEKIAQTLFKTSQ